MSSDQSGQTKKLHGISNEGELPQTLSYPLSCYYLPHHRWPHHTFDSSCFPSLHPKQETNIQCIYTPVFCKHLENWEGVFCTGLLGAMECISRGVLCIVWHRELLPPWGCLNTHTHINSGPAWGQQTISLQTLSLVSWKELKSLHVVLQTNKHT